VQIMEAVPSRTGASGSSPLLPSRNGDSGSADGNNAGAPSHAELSPAGGGAPPAAANRDLVHAALVAGFDRLSGNIQGLQADVRALHAGQRRLEEGQHTTNALLGQMVDLMRRG
jgi:hypothetical protein